MKILNKSILVMVLLILTTLSTTNSTFSVIASTDDSLNELIVRNYVTHGPIYIDYDDNFTTPYNFPGAGTPGDPYRIEGYNITVSGDYPILFSGNNTKHFVIQNCYLQTDTNIGIYLGKYYEMGEGTVKILDNTIIINALRNGIELFGGNYSEIKGNTIITNNYGITMQNAEYSFVSGNIITSSDESGIYTVFCPNSTFTRNNCSGGYLGIELYQSSDSSLTHNNCSYNDYGILLDEFSRGTVSNNILLGNLNDGIDTNYCYDTVFTNNLLQENRYGIYINPNSDNNEIHHNAFINNIGGTSQANDDGSNNVWYETTTSEGNYWYNGTVATSPYSIDGTASSVDPYPLSSIPVIPEYSGTHIAVLLILNFLLIPVISFAYRKKKR